MRSNTKSSTSNTPVAIPALPKGVTALDLKRMDISEWEKERIPDQYDIDFELWAIKDWGWVIPTLLIRNASRRMIHRGVESERTYAVRVDERARGNLVRVGMGPHVLKRVQVIVRKSRLADLQWLIDLRREGSIKAHQARDHRSSMALRRRDVRWMF